MPFGSGREVVRRRTSKAASRSNSRRLLAALVERRPPDPCSSVSPAQAPERMPGVTVTMPLTAFADERVRLGLGGRTFRYVMRDAARQARELVSNDGALQLQRLAKREQLIAGRVVGDPFAHALVPD